MEDVLLCSTKKVQTSVTDFKHYSDNYTVIEQDCQSCALYVYMTSSDAFKPQTNCYAKIVDKLRLTKLHGFRFCKLGLGVRCTCKGNNCTWQDTSVVSYLILDHIFGWSSTCSTIEMSTSTRSEIYLSSQADPNRILGANTGRCLCKALMACESEDSTAPQLQQESKDLRIHQRSLNPLWVSWSFYSHHLGSLDQFRIDYQGRHDCWKPYAENSVYQAHHDPRRTRCMMKLISVLLFPPCLCTCPLYFQCPFLLLLRRTVGALQAWTSSQILRMT